MSLTPDQVVVSKATDVITSLSDGKLRELRNITTDKGGLQTLVSTADLAALVTAIDTAWPGLIDKCRT